MLSGQDSVVSGHYGEAQQPSFQVGGIVGGAGGTGCFPGDQTQEVHSPQMMGGSNGDWYDSDSFSETSSDDGYDMPEGESDDVVVSSDGGRKKARKTRRARDAALAGLQTGKGGMDPELALRIREALQKIDAGEVSFFDDSSDEDDVPTPQSSPPLPPEVLEDADTSSGVRAKPLLPPKPPKELIERALKKENGWSQDDLPPPPPGPPPPMPWSSDPSAN